MPGRRLRKTVERHMAGIFAKLDVGSRTEAVRAATRAGAIRDPELGVGDPKSEGLSLKSGRAGHI